MPIEIYKKIRLFLYYLAGHKRQVTAAVIEKDGKVLIAKRSRGNSLGGKWEFPGGKVEPGETAESCLKREIKEEFGIETEIGSLVSSSVFWYCFIPIELLAYRVRHVSGDFRVNEHEEIKWVGRGELDDYDFMVPDKPIIKTLSEV